MPSVRERYRMILPIVQRDSNPVRVAPMATEVAPGVHRLGNEMVNFYLVEADGGLHAHRRRPARLPRQLEEFLRSRGRPSPTSTRCCSRTRTATTWASPRRSGKPACRSASTSSTPSRRGPPSPTRARAACSRTSATAQTWRLLAMGMRNGGMQAVKIAEVSTFGEGELDVPGRPRVIHTPGHSPGHVVFHFAEQRRADRRRRAVHLEPAHGPPGAADHAGRVLVLERSGDGLAGADRGHRGGGAAGRATAIRGPPGWARRWRGRARPGLVEGA